MNGRSRHLAVVIAGFLVAVTVVAFLLGPWLGGEEEPELARRYVDGSATGPGMTGHFSLRATDGRRVTHAAFEDRWLLVVFGYTSCPDICPTTLQTVTVALRQLGAKAERLQPLFITVDPERDTSERLAEYLDHFHPALVGLSGSVEEVEAAARGFGVHFQKGKEEKDGGGYLVDHSSGLLLFAPGSRFEAILRMEGDPEKLAETLSDYL